MIRISFGGGVITARAELDSRILDNLTRREAAAGIRDGLRKLYSVIKNSDANIRFALLTGVSKSSKVSLFSGLNNLNPIARYEGYYASVFDAYFASLGLNIVAEESSNAGRLDMAVRFSGQVYLFEFKVVELDLEGRALQQIKDRGYADKYAAEGVAIHSVELEFSRERRTLAGFEVESRAEP